MTNRTLAALWNNIVGSDALPALFIYETIKLFVNAGYEITPGVVRFATLAVVVSLLWAASDRYKLSVEVDEDKGIIR